jgi:hypothetical protein
MSRTNEKLKLTAFTTVPVSDIGGMCPVGYALFIELDTPKNTPSTLSLENSGATESNTYGRDLSLCHGAKSNHGPEFGLELANERSIAYARIAY